MGKKKKIQTNDSSLSVQKVIVPPAVDNSMWYTKFSFQVILLIIVGLLCFANSFKNLYALDDDAIILKNQYVQTGFKGIPQILSSDATGSLDQQYGVGQELSGGRYRPLSIVSFAIEQQLFGTVLASDTTSLLLQGAPTAKEQARIRQLAHIRHGINVILYVFSVLVLFYFLRNFIFVEQPLIAFLTSLLFLTHPVHTEVVANIKSRDEILSFLFIILTFIEAFLYYNTQHKKYLWLALGFYFLALLSKEYAISLLVLLPMLFYIVKKESIAKCFKLALPFFVVAVVYIVIRVSTVGLGSDAGSSDVLNNPFLFATDIEKIATKLLILDRYLWLLIHPAILSSDYSYNTIPYTDFTDIYVWISLLILIGMIVAAIILLGKRNIISFALAFYLLHLFLVSNFVFDLGATMGERLIYHSSLGFVMILAIGINFLLQKINSAAIKGGVLVSICLLLVGWCAAKDIERNKEWKENATLYSADVKKYPNSSFLNNNASSAYIDSAYAATDTLRKYRLSDSAIVLLKKATSIHDHFTMAYLNLGFAYFMKGELDSAKENYDKVKSLFSTYALLPAYYHQLGVAYSTRAIAFEGKDPAIAIHLFENALACDPDNADYLNNLAFGYYHFANQPDKAKQLWQRSLQIVPNNQPALQGLSNFK
jgi:tetratricopeptide (TPR) repeat protein